MHASFLSRVSDAKARYVMQTGDHPEQLFLGPREYMEFREMCASMSMYDREQIGELNWLNPSGFELRCECDGMTIIGLMSDGLRAGRTVE